MTYEDRFLRCSGMPSPAGKSWASWRLQSTRCRRKCTGARKKFCNYVVSNYGANPMREQMFETLSRYKRVESGGRSRNNQPDGKPVADKLAFQQQCRFSLAFENAQTIGYCTEKILDAFCGGHRAHLLGRPGRWRAFTTQRPSSTAPPAQACRTWWKRCGPWKRTGSGGCICCASPPLPIPSGCGRRSRATPSGPSCTTLWNRAGGQPPPQPGFLDRQV